MPFCVACHNPLEPTGFSTALERATSVLDVYQHLNNLYSTNRSYYNSMVNPFRSNPEIFERVDGKTVAGMITGIIAAKKKHRQKIDKLFFVGHGSAGGMPIGQQWVGLKEIDSNANDGASNFRPEFLKVRPLLAKNAEIYFMACNMAKGNGKKMLREFASIFGCKVYGCDYFRWGGDPMEKSANVVCTATGCKKTRDVFDLGAYVGAGFMKAMRAVDAVTR